MYFQVLISPQLYLLRTPGDLHFEHAQITLRLSSYETLVNPMCKFFMPPAAARGREKVGTPHTPPGAEPLDPVEKHLHIGLVSSPDLARAFIVTRLIVFTITM